MIAYEFEPEAARHMQDIYSYSEVRWSEAQGRNYLEGIINRIDLVTENRALWRAPPFKLGVPVFMTRYKRHIIYWREFEGDALGILAVLHQNMEQERRLAEILT